MNEHDLKNCIALGEGQTTEFKRALSEDFGREIAAFANSIGGTLLIGVDDKGTVVGVERINRAKAQIQNTARSLDPPVKVTVESVGNVLVVTVPRSAESPQSSGGRFYLREGASCRQMGRAQIREYFFREGMLLFDTMINPEFDPKKDLVKRRYFEFAKTAGISRSVAMPDALRNIKLLTDKGMTNPAKPENIESRASLRIRYCSQDLSTL
jgi:ATP-dependent DNA helicase RecG